MDMTKEALKLFIQSLPAGCQFEIISFGSAYKVASKDSKGFNNTDAVVKSIKNEIDSYDANMGGTEIYAPLNFTISEFQKKGAAEDKGLAKFLPKGFG